MVVAVVDMVVVVVVVVMAVAMVVVVVVLVVVMVVVIVCRATSAPRSGRLRGVADGPLCAVRPEIEECNYKRTVLALKRSVVKFRFQS